MIPQAPICEQCELVSDQPTETWCYDCEFENFLKSENMFHYAIWAPPLLSPGEEEIAFEMDLPKTIS
jgi:hypothetical protein